jgi:hypothetical protein
MKRHLIILIFLIRIALVNAQTTLRGIIRDADTREGVSYVSVGLRRTTFGSVSDTLGRFELSQLPQNTGGDSISFYCIGYARKTVARTAFSADQPLEINLQPTPILLREAVIVPDRSTTKWIGEYDVSTSMNVNFALNERTNQNLGSEIGRRFNVKKPTRLEHYRFFIAQNNFDVVRFRINIYNIGQSNQPDVNLLQQPIIIQLDNKKTGWIEVDLTPYDIRTDKPVVVSAEWIDFTGRGTVLSLPIGLLRFDGGHFYKFGSQNKWKVFNSMSSPMQLRVRQ